MMKVKPVLIALVLMLVLLGGASYSYAVPVQGVVDPGSNWATTLTGTATYTFTNLVGGTNAPMVGLGLDSQETCLILDLPISTPLLFHQVGI